MNDFITADEQHVSVTYFSLLFWILEGVLQSGINGTCLLKDATDKIGQSNTH